MPNSNHPYLLPLILFMCVPAAFSASELFPFSQVTLGEGPFLNARQRDFDYMLAHEVDRFMVPFREEAGLPAKGESYPNWEATGLDGHVGGHYLSALAQMAVVTGDPEMRRRLDYMVAELALCQEANGNGYVGGVRGGKALWESLSKGEIKAEAFHLNDVWVPWYNLHKTFAGLRDAWLVAGNPQAREVFLKLCDWCVGLLDQMSAAQVQQMLVTEHGGMNEVLADAFAMTGDPRYLAAARTLSDRRILDPLLAGRDELDGLHANTQIPKVIGYARVGSLGNDAGWLEASRFFWNTVVNNRSVAIGGNSVSEHFNPKDDFSSMIEHHEGPETCNTYNMLRLTELLFAEEPGSGLADFYETGLYNHILSSQHPDRGGFVYFTPMRPRHYRVYSQPGQCFWCCVGSGMENHGKYGRFIYAHSGKDTLFVNLFVASTLDWADKALQIVQRTDFPYEQHSRLTVRTTAGATRFVMKVRRPAWTGKGYVILVNGEVLHAEPDASGYVSINRRWQDGDRVDVWLPMKMELRTLPDGYPYAALVYGPIVLAADLSKDEQEGRLADDGRMSQSPGGPKWPLTGAPSLKGSESEILAAIRPVPERPLSFILDTGTNEFTLRPFFATHDCRYMVYWPLGRPD